MAYDTEWSEGKRIELTDLNKDDRSRLRPIVGAVIAAILVFGSLIYAANVWAVPLYEAAADGAKVTLHDDDCQMKDVVENLPKKATWHEQGKVYQGCWGARPEAGIILAYFADKTVVYIPIQLFQRVSGA